MAKLSPAEFVGLMGFEYSIPMIVLDFIDEVTGSNILKQSKEVTNISQLIPVMDPWEKEFTEFKERNLDPDFIKYPWASFNRLGELDFDVLERKNQCIYDEMKRERF